MTSSAAVWQSYRKVSAHTAPPAQLVLMLYDGAISFLEKALTGFDYSDPKNFNETINNNLLRAQDIIHEMNARLDMDRGEEVAKSLRDLYNYFYRRLLQANLKKAKAPIEEVAGHLRGLRGAWAEMLHRGQQGPDEYTALDVS